MRSQKWTKNGTPLPGYLVLDSVSGGPFFGHLLIWPDAGAGGGAGGAAAGRTLAPGGPGERNRRCNNCRMVATNGRANDRFSTFLRAVLRKFC